MPSQLMFGQQMYVGGGPGYTDQSYRQAELQAEEFYGADPANVDNWRIDDLAFSPLWPGRSGFCGESEPLIAAPPAWMSGGLVAGAMNALGFSGVTRDGNNTPVAGMTVRLFRTSDSALVATTTSRYDGSYNVSTPYAGQDHFITCHKAGSPEIAGASQSTLEPW